MQTVLALIVLGLLGLIAGQVAASRQFRARILTLAGELRKAPPTRNIEAALPPVVADFARRAGADPARPLRIASFNQHAELRLRPGGAFTKIAAWQLISLGRPGFLWDARAAGVLPRFHVLDAYVAGAGQLEARALGSIPLARETGAEIDLAEAFRYLAELPWVPDAILGNPELSWRVIGADAVEVRMKAAGGTARVRFRFDGEGDIVRMDAQGRPAKDINGQSARFDWRGRYWDYREIGARRIPARAEVGYVYPSGYEVYFRGEITGYHLSD
ncbi:DUF6544 family protein [Defluviimonas sp. SAOS-178_SWC]|uniref:DUF6544 family protein n=1 Tax=Defluviimonas sp. SAOS-178_SWC TaxID=3121287 RepID=UPI003221C08B